MGNPNTTGVPQKKGFDEFLGYLDQTHAHDYYTDYLWRYDPPSDAKPGYDGRVEFPENQGGKKGMYMDDLFTTAALNFVRINKPEPFNNYRPFFLYLAYTIPHANNEEGQRTGNGMEVPSDAPYSDQPWPPAEKNKAAMITRLDADVGQLLDKLKELKMDDNTIIFFSSDNGPHKEGGVDPKFFQSAGPLRGIKRDLYEGGIRVPLIVRWPGKIKPGTVNDQPWAFWDFLPTAAEIAGAKRPGEARRHFHAAGAAGQAANQPPRFPLLGISRARLSAGRAHGRLESRAPASRRAARALQPEHRPRREAECGRRRIPRSWPRSKSI